MYMAIVLTINLKLAMKTRCVCACRVRAERCGEVWVSLGVGDQPLLVTPPHSILPSRLFLLGQVLDMDHLGHGGGQRGHTLLVLLPVRLSVDGKCGDAW